MSPQQKANLITATRKSIESVQAKLNDKNKGAVEYLVDAYLSELFEAGKLDGKKEMLKHV